MPTYHYGNRVYRSSRRSHRRRQPSSGPSKKILSIVLIVLLAAGAGFGIYKGVGAVRNWVHSVMDDDPSSPETGAAQASGSAQESEAESIEADYSPLIKTADAMALQYDYDGAIALLKQVEGYENSRQLSEAISRLNNARTGLVKTDITKVAQLSVKTLIADTTAAFSSGSKETLAANYLTLSEFQAILQQLYDNGYVLVSLHDMAYTDANGYFVGGGIWLPANKKALVLSVEETGTLEANAGLGLARRLVIDEEGNPKSELLRRDGTVASGDLDVVPVLESFIKTHPDFSYKGARGILALTGYDGILGYRTAAKYSDHAHPDYKPAYDRIDAEAERTGAIQTAARLKELGWEFASRSWGHLNMAKASLERIQDDYSRWKDQVESLIGQVDILFFDNGTDIGNWRSYSAENEKYAYLSSVGFRYFCGVDLTTIPWVQLSTSAGYLRQGRVTVNGTQLITYPTRVEPFFDAGLVTDPARP